MTQFLHSVSELLTSEARGREMKSGCRDVTLGEIFEISSSKRVLQKQWKTTGVPFYRAREIVKLAKNGTVQNKLFISEELFEDFRKMYGVPAPGDLMVSAVGTLGACYVVQPADRFYFKDASVLRFSPKEPIHPKFIQYAFGTNQILDQIHAGSGSTVGTFTISRAKETRLSLPPLDEQKRIAAILDQADELRRLRQRAIDHLNELDQAIFYEMFGDLDDETSWKPLGKHATKIGSGATPKGGDASYKTNGIPLVRSMNVRDGFFDPYGLAFIDTNQAQKLQNVVLCENDVLLNITGASVARSCVAPQKVAGGRVNQHVAIIRLKETLKSEFLQAFLLFPRTKTKLLAIAESGATRQAITKSQIENLVVPIPPIEYQEQFVIRRREVAEMKKMNTQFSRLLKNTAGPHSPERMG